MSLAALLGTLASHADDSVGRTSAVAEAPTKSTSQRALDILASVRCGPRGIRHRHMPRLLRRKALTLLPGSAGWQRDVVALR